MPTVRRSNEYEDSDGNKHEHEEIYSYQPEYEKYAKEWEETGHTDFHGWADEGGSRGTCGYGYAHSKRIQEGGDVSD